MSEKKPKKMVRRRVAMALGIICVVVVAGLVGAFAYYVNDKNNTISSLTSQISTKDSQIEDEYSQISQLNSNITNLQNQINNLNAMSNLEFSTFWQSSQFVATMPENIGGLSYVDSPIVPYAGYVKVEIEPSNNTYVRVLYNSQGTSFDYEVPVNANGTGIIPVLPTNFINIGVGNLTIGATYTTNMTYYY
jgi:cell division protein FtsB